MGILIILKDIEFLTFHSVTASGRIQLLAIICIYTTCICQSKNFSYSQLLQQLQTVVQITFPGSYSIACINDNNDQVINYIEQALIATEKSYCRFNNSSLNVVNASRFDGYVLVSSEAERVINLFSNNINILPYTRFIVISNTSVGNSLSKFFTNLTGNNAVQVLLISMLEQHSLDSFGNEIYRNFEVRTTVFSSGTRINIENLEYYRPAISWKLHISRTLRVATFSCTPYMIFDDNNNPYDGIEYHIIKHITSGLVMEFILPSGNISVPGIITTVVSGAADLGACGIWLQQIASNPSRVDITYPHGVKSEALIVPRQIQIPNFLFVYEHLNHNVWLSIGITLFIQSFIVFKVANAYRSIEEMNTKGATFLLILTDLIRVLSGTATTCKIYNKDATRQLLTTWLVCCLLLTTAYSAGITNALTKSKRSKSPATIKEVVASNLSIRNTAPFVKEFCRFSSNPDLRAIAKQFSDRCNNTRCATFVKEFSTNYFDYSEVPSDIDPELFKILEERIDTMYVTFVFAKDSPLTQYFNYHLRKLSAHGFLVYWNKRAEQKNWNIIRRLYTRRSGSSTLEVNYMELSFAEFRGAFLLLAVGYFSALMLFFIELLTNWRNKNKCNQEINTGDAVR